jgi:hypothetical protein
VRAFRTRRPNESHRARLRVELGRLRAVAAPLARIEALRASQRTLVELEAAGRVRSIGRAHSAGCARSSTAYTLR